ncbi:MFS transporter [Streptomyces sp. NPDC060194]|uniref:MFS transporter n=1 Tax=Streptomyces sp. NPDC060194 TaxID=3347069 RepID=UPI0036572AD7
MPHETRPLTLSATAETPVAVPIPDDGPVRRTGGPSTSRPPSRPPRRNPYARLFAAPGTRAFTAGGLLARLPMGMFSVSAVIMIATTRGSYALAGAVTATGLIATALVAPYTARLVDRHGQARIAVPATVPAVLGSIALVLCVRHDAPDWTLFACYAATATTPNVGGMSRARWTHLYRSEPGSLHTANSFEQAADELCFMIGPVLAALLCSTLFPEAGTLAAALLLLTGVLVFTAQRATEPPRTPRTPGVRARSPLRAPGMPGLLVVFLATGAVFGAMEIATVARATASSATLVLALQATGSFLAGLWYGSRPAAADPGRRLPLCLAAMTGLMSLPFAAAAATASVWALAPALLLAGMATAPAMVTGMALVQLRVPAGRLNEGMTVVVTALLGGIAGGSAAGGWTTEHLGPTAAFAVPIAAAALATAAAWRMRTHRP